MKKNAIFAKKNIVLLELNEVPFRVLDVFCERFPRSELNSFMSRCHQFVTVCEDSVELDPWISWPTLHRGVSDSQHRILHLGQTLDGVDQRFPPLWRLMAAAGKTVGVFGSIHSNNVPLSMENYKFYVPDFFDDKVFAYPNALEAFQRFNLEMTRRSARNVDTAIPRSAALRFMRSAIALGVSLDTVREILSQLIQERREPRTRLRRRSLQALLMADVFVGLLRKDTPNFATFYSNHVAASMHRYWAAAFPNDYDPNLMTVEWQRSYSAEVFEAVRIFDKMLGKLRQYVENRKDTILMVASSMGQRAVQVPPSNGFFTIKNIGQFMTAFGIKSEQFQQRHAMVPCTGVVVDHSVQHELKSKLDQLSINNNKMVESANEVNPMSYSLHDGSFFAFYVYFDSYSGEHVAYIGNQPKTFEDLGIGFVPHEDGVSVTAHHHPDGVLLIYDPEIGIANAQRKRISTLEIAPAVMEHFGISPPQYMVAPSSAVRDALHPVASRGQPKFAA